MMKIPSLKYWANFYGRLYWGREISHPIIWNKKLTRTNGYVKYRSLKEYTDVIEIAMSPRILNHSKNERQNFHTVLLHELCHYFMHIDGIQHTETSKNFIDELKRVGGVLPVRLITYRWHCKSCKKFMFSAKSVNQEHWKRIDKFKSCPCPLGLTGIPVNEIITEGYR